MLQNFIFPSWLGFVGVMSLNKTGGSYGKVTDWDFDKCPDLTNFLSLLILSLTNTVHLSLFLVSSPSSPHLKDDERFGSTLYF